MTYLKQIDSLVLCIYEPVLDVRKSLLDKIQGDPDFFAELDDDQRFQVDTVYSDCCSNVAVPTWIIPKQLQPA